MTEEKQKIVKESGKMKLIIVDTSSNIHEGNDNDVIITGSHCGINSGRRLAGLNIKGAIGNDAGKGKNNAGIAGLELLNEAGIPGAAVSTMSAHIGIGMSTYERGRISAVNNVAEELGIVVGMSAKEAADRMFESLVRKTK